MKRIIDVVASRYWNRTSLHVATGTVFTVLLVCLAAIFVTSGPDGPVIGETLGNDFGQFYAESVLLNRNGVGPAYDFQLQNRILLEAVPGFPEGMSLPFIYPPFTLLPIWPLSYVPYAAAYFAFLMVIGTSYSIGVAVAISAGNIPKRDRLAIWLIALSFAPFLISSCMGGQISPIGALFMSLAIACDRWKKPFFCGAMLSMLFYKPTLPGLLILMVIAGLRWRTFLGMVFGASLLAVASIGVVGIDGAFDYARTLIEYSRFREVMSGRFAETIYIDMPSYLTSFGIPRADSVRIAFVLGLPIVSVLGYAWFRTRSVPSGGIVPRSLLWAATACWLPLLNQYGPIYDVALVVPGLIVADGALNSRSSSFRWVVAALYIAALARGPAALVGINSVTPALFMTSSYLLYKSIAISAESSLVQDVEASGREAAIA